MGYWNRTYSTNFIKREDLKFNMDLVLLNQITNDESVIDNAIELAIEECQAYISQRYDDNLITKFEAYPLTTPIQTGITSPSFDTIKFFQIEGITYSITTNNGTLTNIESWTYYKSEPIFDTTGPHINDNVSVFKRDNLLLSMINDIAIYHIYSRISTRETPERVRSRYDETISKLKSINKGQMSPQNWTLKGEGTTTPSGWYSPLKSSSINDVYGNQGSSINTYFYRNKNYI